MKKFLGSMAKKTTDAAKSLAAEATKKKAGTNKHIIKNSDQKERPKIKQTLKNKQTNGHTNVLMHEETD
jgi:hypothetical protein